MDHLLTTLEIAERFRVSTETIRLWSREGLIPAIRIRSNVVRYDYLQVLAVLKKAAVDRPEDASQR